jgi:nitrite reductase/ring-hydroxylating ferredoxin subunit
MFINALKSSRTLIATTSARAFHKVSTAPKHSYYMIGGLALGGFTALRSYSTTMAESAFKEFEITFASELKDGDMKTIKVGDKDSDKVLISRYAGKLYATGNACTHFGVPLEGGMLYDDKVMCPAHAAAFSVKDGSPENGPGLDGLPTFKIVEDNGKYFVQIPASGLPKSTPVPLTKQDPSNHTNYVIVGGGAAGLNAAETLRQSGFSGVITVITNEDSLPYDRTLITKALVQGDSKNWTLRPAEYLANADITFKFKSRVTGVDTTTKQVMLDNGMPVVYDKLLIATGGAVVKPSIEGVNAPNVHFLRSNHDQTAIKAKAEKAGRIVIVGAGFIGSEAASCLAMKYGKDASKQIHLVSNRELPLEKVMGKEYGRMLKNDHEANGIKFHS